MMFLTTFKKQRKIFPIQSFVALIINSYVYLYYLSIKVLEGLGCRPMDHRALVSLHFKQ